jgi:hypothetical protein
MAVFLRYGPNTGNFREFCIFGGGNGWESGKRRTDSDSLGSNWWGFSNGSEILHLKGSKSRSKSRNFENAYPGRNAPVV